MINKRVYGGDWADYLETFYKRIPEYNATNFDRNRRNITIRVNNDMIYSGLYDAMYNEILVNVEDIDKNDVPLTRLLAHEFMHMASANRDTLYNGERYKKCHMGLCKYSIARPQNGQPELDYDFGGSLDEGMTEEMVKRAGLFGENRFYPKYQSIVTALDDLILDGEASHAYFDGGFDRIYNAIADKVDGGQERLGHLVTQLDKHHYDYNLSANKTPKTERPYLLTRSIDDVINLYHARAMDINDWHLGIDYLRDTFGPIRRIDTVENCIENGVAPRKKHPNPEFVKMYEKSL